MKSKLKKEEGISGVDITIAIGIIIVFVSIIAVVYINLYMVNIGIERMQRATNYAVQILEKAEELDYDNVTEENFAPDTNRNIQGINISKGYNVNITIEKYAPEDVEDVDVVKKIHVTVSYKVGKKEETVNLHKIKTREVINQP